MLLSSHVSPFCHPKGGLQYWVISGAVYDAVSGSSKTNETWLPATLKALIEAVIGCRTTDHRGECAVHNGCLSQPNHMTTVRSAWLRNTEVILLPRTRACLFGLVYERYTTVETRTIHNNLSCKAYDPAAPGIPII